MPGGFILRKLSIKTVTFIVSVFICITLILSMEGCATARTKEIKDSINQLSFSHDGKKILFDRCREEVCQIQVYNLETGELSAYQSPPNERWTMARYSYDGKNIVFSAVPMGEEYLDLSEMQIAIMYPDGKNVKKITAGPGAKIYPVFSHSGKKVLYAKAAYIRKKGGTPAAQFDAWEVDLETGEEKRLTYFKFFTMNNLTYFPDDERFIFDGRRPEAYPDIRDNDKEAIKKMLKESSKKNMPFHGIQIMRGRKMIPNPYSIEGKLYPGHPLLSKDGTHLLFEGNGQKYYLYSPDGKHRLIGGGGSVNSAAISPDGELLGIIYANWIITIYRIQDGSSLWISLAEQPPTRVYGGLQNERSITTLPGQPMYIINR